MKKEEEITKYRSLFVSDLHMGKTSSRHGSKPSVLPLLKFLENKEFEYIYLLGDIFDIWELILNCKWDNSFNLFIEQILAMHRKGSKVFYIIGNHDDFFERINGLNAGGIEFHEEVFHITAQDKKFLVSHGQKYDYLNKFSRFFRMMTYSSPKIISWFTYKMVEWIHTIAPIFGKRTREQSNEIFRDRVMEQCYKKDLDGVICGHFHMPDIITMKKGKIYINTGDSCKNFTLVTENKKGNFKLHRLEQ